jgi:hypothetical protein
MKQIRESTRFFPSVRASVRLLKDSCPGMHDLNG